MIFLKHCVKMVSKLVAYSSDHSSLYILELLTDIRNKLIDNYGRLIADIFKQRGKMQFLKKLSIFRVVSNQLSSKRSRLGENVKGDESILDL
jgi:hypothetical protein